MSDWTDGFFDEWYLDHFGFPDPAETDVESEALRSLLPEPPARVLDLACGQGRHSIRLAKVGYDVVGLDSSSLFIEQARRASEDLGVQVEFVEGDMRDVSFDAEFDVVVSLFTSWGFGDDATNQLVLDGVGRALRDEGLFVLEINNRDWILLNYAARDWQTGSDGTVVWVERHFDAVRGVNVVTHRWKGPDGKPAAREHEVRFYTPPELGNMLLDAGMVPVAWYGGFFLEPFSSLSRRLLVTARKS
jgi:ubiquinone/menaquinone biosynthesis C-methylase UbiE